METMNISLPKSMKQFVDSQVLKEGYSSASEYIRALVREELKRRAEARLEALLLEGLESGEPNEMGPDDWRKIREEGLAQLKIKKDRPNPR